jgi:hypothetical protein
MHVTSSFEFPTDANIRALGCYILMRTRIGYVQSGPCPGDRLCSSECAQLHFGHSFANGSGPIKGFYWESQDRVKAFFLCTAQYKLIKCGFSTLIIQSRTKLNNCDGPQYQDMQRELQRWIRKDLSLSGHSHIKNILGKHFNLKPVYLFYNLLVLSNNGLGCVLSS